MKIRFKGTPLKCLIYHPHQGFWNWGLTKIINKVIFIPALSKSMINGIIRLDTYYLKKTLNKKTTNVNNRGYTAKKTINFFDLGTHKNAYELRWAYDEVLSKLPNPCKLYAFEANPVSYQQAIVETKNIPGLKMFNVALVNNIPVNGMIRLYTMGDGLGDSIYRSEESNYVDVPAKKFSAILKEEKIDLANSINILRMNVEGAEYEIIKDIIENDLVKFFSGFYGMWDDLSKIDYDKSEEFRQTLTDAGIYTYPFNGRDMKRKPRTDLIKLSLERSIFGLEGKP